MKRKNDDGDGEATAAARAAMRSYALRARRIDVQALHRARERLVAERTALINQMRALLLERGVVLRQGRRVLAAWADEALAEPAGEARHARLRFHAASLRWVLASVGQRRRLDPVQLLSGHLHEPDALPAARRHASAQTSLAQPAIGRVPVHAEPLGRLVQVHSAPGSRTTLPLQIGRPPPSPWRNTRRWIMEASNASRFGGRQPAAFSRSAMAAAERPCPRRSRMVASIVSPHVRRLGRVARPTLRG